MGDSGAGSARDVEIVTRTKACRIDMALSPEDRDLSFNSRMIIDATTPFEWKDHPQAGIPSALPSGRARRSSDGAGS